MVSGEFRGENSDAFGLQELVQERIIVNESQFTGLLLLA
jgi:hypothetical protein